MASGWREWLGAWKDLHIEAERYVELDEGRVLVLARGISRGFASGIDTGQMRSEAAVLFHIRDGAVTRLIVSWDRALALAHLGVEEQAISDESTTPDLEERVARLVDAVNAQDFEAMAGFYAGDAVYDGRRSGRCMEGREAIRGFLEEWFGVYEDFECEVGEIRDLGHGVTFVVLDQHARLSGTTAWVRERFPLVHTWADGLIQRSTSYIDIDQARVAAERLAEKRT
jgi:ketosteroid isomerase-like protein